MQDTKLPKNLEQIFASIAANPDPRRLRFQRENAVAKKIQEVVDAVDRRLVELQQAGIAVRRARKDAEKVAARAAGARQTIRYRGAFKKDLIEHLLAEPDQRILIWLPLAKKAGREERGRVPGVIRLQNRTWVIVENLERGTEHSSLSNFRAGYEDEGGGTDSWSRIQTGTGISIAKYLGVNPALARESLRD